MSRNRTRPPLADTSMFSATLAPLNSISSKRDLTLGRVAVVLAVPRERVVTGPEQAGIIAVAAVVEIVALTADEHVGAEAAVHRRWIIGLERGRVDDVVAAERVQRQPVVRLLLEEDVDRALEPRR